MTLIRLWLAFIALALSFVCATQAAARRAAKRQYVFRYYLVDKAHSHYTLQRPQAFLSRQSLERRRRQHLGLDSTDLPVTPAYVRQFRVKGAEVVGTSRWHNTVVVRAADSLLLRRLAALPIVREARCVYITPDTLKDMADIRWRVHNFFNRWDSVRNDPYGMARQQVEMLGGVRMHDAGFTGRGVTIAVLDGGFQNFDRIPALQHATLLGIRDFVTPANTAPHPDTGLTPSTRGTTFQFIDHGTKVFSAMAAYAPEVAIGTAPEAAYWLLRSEDNASEQPVEEDYWTMAAEFADSVGADIISSSLGYNTYDRPMPGYSHADLDGHTAFISQSASLLAAKGIVLCNSAGNSGLSKWRRIGVPADATDIIAVGAVDADGSLALFSSVGPSADDRVKPDVVARGKNTALLSGQGKLVFSMGTSFATPLVSGMTACLWQALPGKTALEIIDLVRGSADRATAPDSLFGYGLPDFWKAYEKGKD